MTYPSKIRRRELKGDFAARLRAEMTDAERRLWAILRNKKTGGLRFRRQQPIGPYVADFYCSVAKLVIELDGDQHGCDHAVAYDEARSRWLELNGYCVLRFPNAQAFGNPQSILDAIAHVIAQHGVPLPENAFGVFDPPSRGG